MNTGVRDIRFLKSSGSRYTVEIDGIAIELTTAMNKIAYGDVDGLEAYLEALEDKVQSREPFGGLPKIVNGTNMLRILEALFRDETLRNWTARLDEYPALPGRAVFGEYFGYIHNLTHCPSDFAAELYDISIRHLKKYLNNERSNQQEALLDDIVEEKNLSARANRHLQYVTTVTAIEFKNRAITDEWNVVRKCLNNNMITYVINGAEINICLSGRQAFGYASHVAAFLTALRESLINYDRQSFVALVKEIGGKAALDVMGTFFHDLSVQFFIKEQDRIAREERIIPKLSVLYKSFFGGTYVYNSPFGSELIGRLEVRIPEIEKYLVASSDQELQTDKPVWKLYYYKYDRAFSLEIVFPVSQGLRHEMQRYFAHIAKPYINSAQPYAVHLYHANKSIQTLLQHMDHTDVTSIVDFSIWDFRCASTAMSQAGYSLTTVRGDLIKTKLFVSFIDPQLADKLIPSKIIPPRMQNPIPPLDPLVFSQIKQYKDELPAYIWLAFRVFEETGGRSTSIDHLTVDDLVRVDGSWVLRLYNYKESVVNTHSGTPNSVNHRLSNELGDELYQYICDTADLRSKLSAPYIFIYEGKNYRSNTNRKPVVLSNTSYLGYLSNFCKEKGILNREGIFQSPSARSIRAEVGRSMFASGASADTVSRKLNNTPAVAATHYDTMYPRDEANKRRLLYAETLDHKLGVSMEPGGKVIQLNTPMYGKCSSSDKCGNCNNCSNCSERIVERSKEGGE